MMGRTTACSARFPRSQVALGNALVGEAVLPPRLKQRSCGDTCVPKCNLGTMNTNCTAVRPAAATTDAASPLGGPDYLLSGSPQATGGYQSQTTVRAKSTSNIDCSSIH